MEMKSFVQDSLRKELSLFESKNEKKVEDWWANLPGKLKRKICDILGLDKSRDVSNFDIFNSSEQDEISAYWKKHKGIVEGFEDSREWINVEKAAKAYNVAKKMLEKHVALLSMTKGASPEAVKQIWDQLHSGKEIDLGYEI